MINKVTLIGNIGGEVEKKQLAGGSTVCNFSLATESSWKDKNDEWQSETQWHRIVMFGPSAERFNGKKGDKAYIEGSIAYRKWENKEGVKMTSTDIKAQVSRLILPPKQKNSNEDDIPY